MIIVSVMYPAQAGSHFDLEYYRHSHRALVKQRLGDALKGFSIEQGLDGPLPEMKPHYTVIARLLFDSYDAFLDSFTPHQAELTGDVVNFTDIEPIMQISEVHVAQDDQDYA